MSERPASTAVAAFVKTPGLSPVKTRLSHAVGPEAALGTYQSCLSALTGLLREAQATSGFFPYWAVAEEQATNDERWREFPRVLQPQSPGLALRLHGVYSELLRQHPGGVLLIGADCPHLPLHFLQEAKRELAQGDCLAVIGPATDGGFTLFGSREDFSSNFWESIPYSAPETREVLLQQLHQWEAQKGTQRRIHLLPSLTDIDTREDFQQALLEIESMKPSRCWPAEQRQALERLPSC